MPVAIEVLKHTLSGAGGKLVFADHSDGDRDLYIVDTDGTDLRQLSDLPGDEYAPDW